MIWIRPSDRRNPNMKFRLVKGEAALAPILMRDPAAAVFARIVPPADPFEGNAARGIIRRSPIRFERQHFLGIVFEGSASQSPPIQGSCFSDRPAEGRNLLVQSPSIRG